MKRPGAPAAHKRRAWAADNPGNAAIREEAYAALRAATGPRMGPRGGVVLDLGCGTGWWLARLLADGHPAANLHGIDADPGRVRAAAARAPGATVSVGDVRAPGLPPGAADVALFMTVLSSLPDGAGVAAALRAAAAALAPGGLLVVWEPRIPTPANRATRRITRRAVEAALGGPTRAATLTVLPPLARRLPDAEAYARLARVPVLRTHVLRTWERPVTDESAAAPFP